MIRLDESQAVSRETSEAVKGLSGHHPFYPFDLLTHLVNSFTVLLQTA